MLQFKEIIETPKLPRHSSWWVNVNLWPQLYGTYLVCTNWSPEEHIQLLSWPSWLALLVNALSASGSSRRKPGRINGPNVKNFLPLHSVLCACTSGFNQTHNLTRNRLVCQSKKAGKLPVFSSNWAQILCVCVCLCVAQWDRAAEKFRKSAGWRTKEGYVWWDWWCWRQTVWAHDCSSPSLIFLSRFCCARALRSVVSIQRLPFSARCDALNSSELLPLIFNKYECKTDQGKCLGFCFYF